jgi:hypothetical protein
MKSLKLDPDLLRSSRQEAMPQPETVLEKTEKVERIDGSEITQRFSAAKIDNDGNAIYEGIERIERIGKIERIDKIEKLVKA